MADNIIGYEYTWEKECVNVKDCRARNLGVLTTNCECKYIYKDIYKREPIRATGNWDIELIKRVRGAQFVLGRWSVRKFDVALPTLTLSEWEKIRVFRKDYGGRFSVPIVVFETFNAPMPTVFVPLDDF